MLTAIPLSANETRKLKNCFTMGGGGGEAVKIGSEQASMQMGRKLGRDQSVETVLGRVKQTELHYYRGIEKLREAGRWTGNCNETGCLG